MNKTIKTRLTITFECGHLWVVRKDGMSLFQSHLRELALAVFNANKRQDICFASIPVTAAGRKVNNVHRR